MECTDVVGVDFGSVVNEEPDDGEATEHRCKAECLVFVTDVDTALDEALNTV
jgi:hypothetical protein